MSADTSTTYSGNRPPPGALHAEFTVVDVSSAISKQLQLPPELHAVGDLAGKLHGFVNGNAQFRTSGLEGASFRSLLLNNLSSEIAQLLDPAQAAKVRAEQQKNANVTSAQAPGINDGLRLMNGVWVRGAGTNTRDGNGALGNSSQKYDNMPGSSAAIYKSLATEGYSAAQVTSALNFTKSIGINDNAYAGYFVGSSKVTRDAIAAHIKTGKEIKDDDVEKPEDVAAVVGAIKAGKMKPEEAPPSVQKVMQDMKKEGVDPATSEPKAIHKYLKEHPKALETAKKEVKAEVKAREGLTEEQKQKQNDAVEKQRGATQTATQTQASNAAGVAKPKPKKLNLDG